MERAAPAGFLYSLKGSRAVTHFKRLLPGAKSLNLLLGRSKGWASIEDRCFGSFPVHLKRIFLGCKIFWAPLTFTFATLLSSATLMD